MEELENPEDDDCKGIVIDDDSDAVDSISDFFKLKGVCVVGKGSDGEEAYQLFKKLHPKFIILDMNMPKYDGAYAIKKIKDEDPNAKIIVVTGYTNYEFDREEVVAVYSKPYDISQIVKTIEEICKDL